MSDKNKCCRVCGTELNDLNWSASRQQNFHYICTKCENERIRSWQKANPDRAKAIWTRQSRKLGRHPFNENRECAQYLGVHVAERVLSHVFKDVERMPMGNSGYDFICSHNKRIDIKSSCQRKRDNNWSFRIDHNTIADYFLCLAFDNRKDLNPLYIWLIPGRKLNHLTGTTISPSTISKWEAYRLDLSKVSICCDVMRSTTVI